MLESGPGPAGGVEGVVTCWRRIDTGGTRTSSSEEPPLEPSSRAGITVEMKARDSKPVRLRSRRSVVDVAEDEVRARTAAALCSRVVTPQLLLGRGHQWPSTLPSTRPSRGIIQLEERLSRRAWRTSWYWEYLVPGEYKLGQPRKCRGSAGVVGAGARP